MEKVSQSSQKDIFLLEQKTTQMEYKIAFPFPWCYDKKKEE
jgi:hypothetical protein